MHSQPNNVKFRYLLLDIGFRLIFKYFICTSPVLSLGPPQQSQLRGAAGLTRSSKRVKDFFEYIF